MQKWLIGGLAFGLLACGQSGNTSELEQRILQLETQLQRLQDASAEVDGRVEVLELKTVSLSHEEVEGQPALIITGVNLHLWNGAGATSDVNGRGNLVIGYSAPSEALPLDREGSHNLVIGDSHNYPAEAYGGLVVGFANLIAAPYSSVSGGIGNQALSEHSSVSGGLGNHASGEAASISGGRFNRTSGASSSVTGGSFNVAEGRDSSVTGGNTNAARGENSAISGGGHHVVAAYGKWRGGTFADP